MLTWIRSKFSAERVADSVTAATKPSAMPVAGGERTNSGNVPPTFADRQHRAADLSKVGGQVSASPQVAAEGFVAWLNQHELAAQAWTVDEVWYLAENDYGPAAGVTLPKRNTFLRALKQRAGVRFAYDERVRRGGKTVKSTIYRFDDAARMPAPIQLAFELAA
jgi:hypothetical protein